MPMGDNLAENGVILLNHWRYGKQEAWTRSFPVAPQSSALQPPIHNSSSRRCDLSSTRRARVHTYTQAHTHMHTHPQAHMCTHAHTHIHTCTHSCISIHTHTYICARTHTHTHHVMMKGPQWPLVTVISRTYLYISQGNH